MMRASISMAMRGPDSPIHFDNYASPDRFEVFEQLTRHNRNTDVVDVAACPRTLWIW